MFPDVPWYHLDKIHGQVKAHLQLAYNEDIGFSWILKNRSRNLIEVFGYEKSEQANSDKVAA